MNDSLHIGSVDDVEVLERDECLRLLHDAGVGCIGLASAGAPELRPVNYLVDGGSLIIRTGEGQILEAARDRAAAAFLVHGADALEHTGWSVNVIGKLSHLPTNEETLALPLRPWASGVKDQFVELSVDRISGRRIPPGRGNR
jgi:nitroimidazol reductase NimA-like FMN-containing flavoprotein (pyridoxamine 5'-phosphate oxidase superfamily)